MKKKFVHDSIVSRLLFQNPNNDACGIKSKVQLAIFFVDKFGQYATWGLFICCIFHKLYFNLGGKNIRIKYKLKKKLVSVNNLILSGIYWTD